MGIDAGRQAKARARVARSLLDTARAALLLGALAVAPGALADNVRGAFSPVYDWPLIPIHAVLTPDGRVFTYGTDGTGRQTAVFIYDLWDPSFGYTAGHRTLPNMTATDVFCGSQLVLPGTAAVFIAGGDNWTGTGTTNTGNRNSTLLDLTTDTLTRQRDMNRARWYSTSTTLLSGEIYIQGGSSGTDRPEIRAIDGTFRLLSTADTSPFQFQYPRNFIAPDGRVFGYDSNGNMYYVNTAGTGAVTRVGTLPSANRGSDASAAMFRPGRILQFGGNSNGAAVIDITAGGTPVVTPTASMGSQRRLANATVLPDGKVLATGGSRVWNVLDTVAYTADIWDPATGQWTVGAAAQRARLYHSTAVLMPDASVLVGGGGAPGPERNLNAEFYYPPYLFDATGQRAPRPQITDWPTTVEIGATLNVQTLSPNAPVARVTMVKTSSVTHGWNMEQRFVELTFRRTGDALAIQAPTRAADAPPGWWMLFVLDANGVPSEGKIVRVGVAANPNPDVVPVLAAVPNQSSVVGVPVSLQLSATDPNGDVLGYGASGLPDGVGIDPYTGAITGTPTRGGTYDVVVAASDGFNNTTRAFVWNVTIVDPLQLAPPTVQPASLIGAPVTFTASATSGVNTRYTWFFDDGSVQGGWSTAPSIEHTFQRPGIYYVTVTAEDDRGQRQSRTFVHRVHLPLTANAPSASGNVAFERVAGTPGRVWVVNPDNNSVSVLDAAQNTRLAEIRVGTAPRALAIAPNGLVWVTNRSGSSISVIDPATLTVSRTVGLPRASLPYGIAFAPTGGFAFVALEGTGQVLKYDVASFARVATAAVGANPRHVSVSADGASVYVARFVTPPLPGEGTASVLPGTAGGEVVVLSAATLAPQRTIVLGYSSLPDFENQGSGVPNYLGAAAISPDGTQAWVPSKQDNVARGVARNGFDLDFQNTVRAISSRISLVDQAEDLEARVDHDNASLATAAAYDPKGNYLFVALETSREVAVLDAHGGWQLFRVDVGRAPQGLALSNDARRLYVHNFMDRSVQAFDLVPLLERGENELPPVAAVGTVATEALTAQVLLGKQLFYDARDPRLSRDRYMSCATCHADGGADGRVWDLTGAGEGLRNTISLRGRAGMGHGFLHWSANFDEIHDFEGQIRRLAGGTGLMADTDYFAGTRSQPLGQAKAGLSPDLDALAAYVTSLRTFDNSPNRASNGTLTAAAVAGRGVFAVNGCGSCHGGTAFTTSGNATLTDVGTIKPTSGTRLGVPGGLTGIDPPTLRDVWATAPYLHDGSAPTLADAVRAHRGVSIPDTDLANLVAYLQQIGAEEAAPPLPAGTGTGLLGNYYNGTTLAGAPLLTRTERVDFGWGSGTPGAPVPQDLFSARWTGFVEAPVTGTYQFQTVSDDGVRLWVDGAALINVWTDHAARTDTSVSVNLSAGQRVPVTMEYYERRGQAVARLRWRTPGNTTFVAIPADRLYAN
jgi:YVTN family beta-propeller protein